jgi:hypothetical protein
MEEGHTIMDIITMTIIVTRKYKLKEKKNSIILVGKSMLPLIPKYGNLCLNASLVSKRSIASY